MELCFTKSFEREYRHIIRGNSPLQKQITKQLEILQVDPRYLSLRLHKLSGDKFWSISIDKSIGILVILEKKRIYVFHIGKHEDVY